MGGEEDDEEARFGKGYSAYLGVIPLWLRVRVIFTRDQAAQCYLDKSDVNRSSVRCQSVFIVETACLLELSNCKRACCLRQVLAKNKLELKKLFIR